MNYVLPLGICFHIDQNLCQEFSFAQLPLPEGFKLKQFSGESIMNKFLFCFNKYRLTGIISNKV